MEDTFNKETQTQETPHQDQMGLGEQQSQQSEQAQDSQQTIAEKKQSKTKEENFRRLQEKYETEKKQLSDRVNQLEQELRRNQGLSDDDLVEGRHVLGIKKELENMRSQMEEAQKKAAASHEEAELKSKYQDLYNVVNEQNLKKLKEVDPVAYDTVMSAPNLYARGHMAYQSIRRWGISDQSDNKEKIEDNLSKPQVGHSSGALGQAEHYKNYLTREEKDARWKEMQKNIRQRR